MNRGSALKWADLIETADVNIDTRGCFKTSDGGFDFIGLLVDFVNGGSWVDTGLGFYVTPDGHCAKVPENVIKKCKIKTDLDSIAIISDASFYDPVNQSYYTYNTNSPIVRKGVANYIRNNYENL